MFEDLIPDLQDPAHELVLAAGQAGLQPRVTSTTRTHTQQARLFRKWQAGLSPFPAAPPGLSAHEFGFAFDMVVTPMTALADVGYTWLDWGGVWSARDPIHFEFPGFVAPPLTPFDLPSQTGKAMGEATNLVFSPAISNIPYIEDVLKVSAVHEPAATASLAAEIYLWLARH